MVNIQFLTPNLNNYPIFKKNIITKYPSDSITYIVVTCGNWLSDQKYIQVINELASYSIT